MTDATTTAFLDKCWARSLGCTVSQLRDGERHVVPVPGSTGGMKRPWPLSANSIAMMTCGQGWVLCVPERLVAQASELCMGWSFADIAAQGDALQEEWFARGAKHEERPTLRNAAKYGPLTRLAESLDVRSWSHYFHWYFDPSPSAEIPVDEHVRLIQEDDPPIWEQWLAWGGERPWGLCSKHGGGYEASGYVLDGRLVSVALMVPDPSDFAWDYGIDTLPEFCRRGFATEACKAVTASILRHGQVPWYYYNHYNHPSSRLPQKMGYFFYSETLVSHGK